MSSSATTVPTKSSTGWWTTPSSNSMSASIVTSELGVATQVSVLPSLRSNSMRAKSEASLCSTSPSSTSTLQVPQVPCVQACGSHTPARRQASRIGWSDRHSTSRPSGSTVIVNVSLMAVLSGWQGKGRGARPGAEAPAGWWSAVRAQVRKVTSPLCPTPVSSSVVSSAGLKSSPFTCQPPGADGS